MIQVISPADGSLVLSRDYHSAEAIDHTLDRARAAQRSWRALPLAERITILQRGVNAFASQREALAAELTLTMGRPIAYSPGEIDGFVARANSMIDQATEALAPVPTREREGFVRYVQREPLGVVLTLAAWNYPYLIAVNSVIPALLAGNAVVLKHAAQTVICGERIGEALRQGGLPDGLYQVLHLSHQATAKVVADPRVDFVAFTGSVAGGQAVHGAAAGHFKAVGLELGGKDPAYVRADADLSHAVSNLVDGAFFNSGQSCCGIERIYVHRSRFDDFVAAFVAEVRRYRLGDPRDPSTTLGPVVRQRAADFIRQQVAAAIAAGAHAHLHPADFPAAQPGTPYLAPQVLTGVSHSMEVMMEETFGPVVGIMPVDDDAEAVRLMNDSPYGLTASVWTPDVDAAIALGQQVDTGTWFLNRCDYLDPELAWVGVKDSGRGCTLSRVGFEHLTRPKSFHLRLP